MAKKKSKKKVKKKVKKKIKAPGTKPEKSTGAPVVTPYPQAGRKVLEFEQRLDQQLGNEGPPPTNSQGFKRPVGRPRKEIEPQPATIDLTVISQAIQVPFDLWSISQGVEQLRITDDEAKLMARPAKELLDYYLPQVPQIAWAWISLTAVTYSVMKSRMMLIQEIRKAKADRTVSPKTPAVPKGWPSPGGFEHFPQAGDIHVEKIV